ncbi:MAG TPA: sodium:calcium antiporter [archaeon]|nr:sodium:calcium antiporter [archaeon]
MALLELLSIIAAFIVLIAASRLAIKSLVSISRHFGVPEFTISFLLVGVIAILPELSIGINSALEGTPSFGLGIVFGSNIADLTLIIGLVALASNGIQVHRYALSQARIFIVAVLLPLVLLLDGTLSRLDGIILVACFLGYVALMFIDRKNWPKFRVEKKRANLPLEFALLAVALIVLFATGGFITDTAISLSVLAGVPLFFLGILIAIGTCLPELNFAIQAARSRHDELGFGDVLGNVLADCMLTLGIIAIISPITPREPRLPILSGAIMAGTMILLIILLGKKGHISRVQGFGLVLLFIVFLAVQLLVEKWILGI